METAVHFTCAMCRVEMEGEFAAAAHLASPTHAYQMLWLQRRALDTQQQIRDLLLQLVDKGQQPQIVSRGLSGWQCSHCGNRYSVHEDAVRHLRDAH